MSCDFLASKRWSIELACERNNLPLLRRLNCHGRSPSSSTHSLYRARVFECALQLAVEHDDCIQLLESPHAYCPSGLTAKGVGGAAYLGNQQAVQ